MVNASIDNAPVSVQLDTNDSVTVPTNEVWKVGLTVFAGGLVNDISRIAIRINNQAVCGMTGNSGDNNDVGGAVSSPTFQAVLTGGDEVTVESNGVFGGQVAIQGFVVDS
jgi:hypothetical protein